MSTTIPLLTIRQKEVLGLVYKNIVDSGFPPTLADIKESLGISSNQAILDFLDVLERKKLIKREEGSARGIKILKKGFETLGKQPLIPKLGTSSAGPFLEGVLTNDWVETSPDVTNYDRDVFIIKIKGDSMIDSGIYDGDALLIQSANEFSTGDIVLASTTNGTTVKRFISQNKPPYMFLKPENPKYQYIPFTNDITLKGKVIAKLNDTQWQIINPKQQSFI